MRRPTTTSAASSSTCSSMSPSRRATRTEMSASCCHHDDHPPARRRVASAASSGSRLPSMPGMFLVEGISGLLGDLGVAAGRCAGFLGDAANYGPASPCARPDPHPSGHGSPDHGASPWACSAQRVVGSRRHNIGRQTVPSPAVMGAVGFLALVCQLGVAAAALSPPRGRQQPPLGLAAAPRNDAIGNLGGHAGLPPASSPAAALWPDLACPPSSWPSLALSSSHRVILQAVR